MCRVSRVRLPVLAMACSYWASSLTAARRAVHLVHPALQLRDRDPPATDDGGGAWVRLATARREKGRCDDRSGEDERGATAAVQETSHVDCATCIVCGDRW